MPKPDSYSTSIGPRHYDKARADEHGRIHAAEDKSGKTGSRNDLRELEKDRELLRKGVIETLRVRTVAGEKMSSAYRELLTEMQQELGSRVIHQELTREQACLAFDMGLAYEKDARQLELRTRLELDRAERARLRLENIREIVKARERAEALERAERAQQAGEQEQARQRDIEKARERAALFRDMERFREGVERGQVEARERAERDREAREQDQARQREETARIRDQLSKDIQAQTKQIARDRESGREIDPDRLYEIHKDLVQGLNVVREREREDTREMLETLHVSRDQARSMELAFELSREEKREDVVKGLNEIALTVQREDQRREAVEKDRREREAQQREREAREAYGQALRQRGIPPEIAALVQHQEALDHAMERGRELGVEPPQVQGRSRGDPSGRGIERTRD
ncbi:hypothetical protein D5S18_29420 [Nocardia panacis]|uniref:Uncharacterized protein n=1 Tax=Nocardia panacis TaxID=2340916 RepID=A0A3A4JMK4_9NOCA|nr:hypothetical protein D5S18_29420 [Nocardia panacis]